MLEIPETPNEVAYAQARDGGKSLIYFDKHVSALLFSVRNFLIFDCTPHAFGRSIGKCRI